MIQFKYLKYQGFTLIQLIITLLIIGILAALAYPSYQKYIRQTRLESASAALMENSRYMERFYSRTRSFKQNSTTWPQLPVLQTEHFCIRFQGNARAVEGDRYTIKAVAFDKSREPRVLMINQDQSIRICGSSRSHCGETVFSGRSGVDRDCSVLH